MSKTNEIVRRTYLITLLFRDEVNNRDYHSAVDILDALGAIRINRSVWVLWIDDSLEQLYNRFTPKLDTNDFFFIAELGRMMFSDEVVRFINRQVAEEQLPVVRGRRAITAIRILGLALDVKLNDETFR